ncbi:hypothetical protein JCGZ_05797 [Jatropha curcas]|uniref:Peptidase A1 domain-containing protein n=1 Tax=Jatropha curcas TaxID=180498 RepID=A0A067KTJ6_JATCU|nr:hypothetical protein JCGZ_05797 [Jatropha curcas]
MTPADFSVISGIPFRIRPIELYDDWRVDISSDRMVELIGTDLPRTVEPGSATPTLSISRPASSDGAQQKWRKAMLSSMMLSKVGSSLVFPLHGNVYPAGYYNVTLNIGQPSKPYFLDVDTGSDLTWLQCDAPCRQCTEAPGEHKCEDPEQCAKPPLDDERGRRPRH